MTIVVKTRSNRIPAIIRAAGARAPEVINRMAAEIEARTKDNIVDMGAVDTGNMLNSTGHLPTDGTGPAEIYVDAEYSAHVHEGHHTPGGGFVEGRPFLKKAFAEVVDETANYFKDVVK